MKTKILRFLTITLTLSILVLSCASVSGSTNNTQYPPLSSVTLDYYGTNGVYLDHFSRVIDHEAGVVCWIGRTGAYGGVGISCIPIDQTLLLK